MRGDYFSGLIISGATTLFLLVLLGQPSLSQTDHHHHGHAYGTALGEVDFATSCNPQAHKLFNQGMLYQHSFWYSASKQAFEQTLKADPGCAIAYWGIAQSLLLNPFGPPSPNNLAAGLAALQKGKTVSAKTPRENDFIIAL